MKLGNTFFRRGAAAVLTVVLLASCSPLTRQPERGEEVGGLQLALGKPVEDVIGLAPTNEVPIAAAAMFITTPVVQSEPLPDILIRKLSFPGNNASEVVKTLLAGTNISVVVRSEAQSSAVLRHSVMAMDVHGKLGDVLERLSNSVGFYYVYRNGVLEISSDMQFIAEVPPVNAIFESLPQMLKALGATDVFLDKSARTITYRATKIVQEKVGGYLNHIRATRSMIAYEISVWEVVLSDSQALGIDWNEFRYTPSGRFGVSVSGTGADVANAVGVGIVYNTASFTLDILARFLKSQGTLRTVAQPKLMLMSGDTAGLSIGSQIPYVAQVGTSTNANTTTTSVTTAQVLSGLEMSLSGDISDHTVFTRVLFSVNDLQRFNNFVAVGTNLQLPQISTKKLTTTVRSRSKDTIVLAGINSTRSVADDQGLPVPGVDAVVPTTKKASIDRTEMVIVLRPTVISFASPTKVAAQNAPSADAPSPKSEPGPTLEVLPRRQPQAADVKGT